MGLRGTTFISAGDPGTSVGRIHTHNIQHTMHPLMLANLECVSEVELWVATGPICIL